MRFPKRVEPGSGQESVWDYPRPPKIEPTDRHIQVIFNGETIVDSRRAWRVLETSHPPVYYIPPEDIKQEYLKAVEGGSWCEWKGQATYFDVVVGDRVAHRAGWAYPRPTPAFASLAGHIAFYANAMDRCLVDGEQVVPQPGRFYGGWITVDIVGPFKGEPGTSGW